MGLFDDDQEWTITPEGDHVVKLHDSELDETGEDPKLTLKFKVKGHGQQWMRFTFKENCEKFNKWQLGVIGVLSLAKHQVKNPDDFFEVARACLDASGELIGNYYTGTIEHSEYKGKTYANLIINDAITADDVKEMSTTKPPLKNPEPPKFNADEELGF